MILSVIWVILLVALGAWLLGLGLFEIEHKYRQLHPQRPKISQEILLDVHGGMPCDICGVKIAEPEPDHKCQCMECGINKIDAHVKKLSSNLLSLGIISPNQARNCNHVYPDASRSGEYKCVYCGHIEHRTPATPIISLRDIQKGYK